MQIDYTGAVNSFRGGLQAGNEMIDAGRRRELHDVRMDTAQLQIDRSRAELNEFEQSASYRGELRTKKLQGIDQKLKEAGLRNDAIQFETFLKSAGTFKQGDQIPDEVVQSAGRLGINMSALVGKRYQRHKGTLEGLMNGEFSRNDPEVLQYLNELAVPMLNRRPGQDPDLELQTVTSVVPTNGGEALALKGRWVNHKTGESYEAPVTMQGRKEGNAPVRAFRVRDLLAWTRSMDGIASQVNQNPDLAKAVADMRHAFMPGKGRYGGLQYNDGIGYYQQGPTGQIQTIGKAGVGAKGNGVGGLKGSDWLARDKATQAHMLELLPEGTDPRIVSAMVGRAQELDRATGGKAGIGQLVGASLQAVGDTPMTPEQAAQRAAAEAQQMLQSNPDQFDNFFGFESDDVRQQWMAQRTQQLQQEAPGIAFNRLNPQPNEAVALINEKYPDATPEEKQAILARYQSLGAGSGGLSQGSATAAAPSEQSSKGGLSAAKPSGQPTSMAEAVAAIAAANPGLDDTEIENRAAVQYPDLFIGTGAGLAGGNESGAGLQTVSTKENELLTSFFKQPKTKRHGRTVYREEQPETSLQKTILGTIDDSASTIKGKMDKARSEQLSLSLRGEDQDDSAYTRYREQFQALRKYRKKIMHRQKPAPALAEKVLPLLKGEARRQAELLAKRAGVKA